MTELTASRSAGAFLRRVDDPDATCIDIVEFFEPKSSAGPYPTVIDPGIRRTALKVAGDFDEVYNKLSDQGIKL